MPPRFRAALPALAIAFSLTVTPALASPASRAPLATIEDLAAYTPQSTCSPAAKPGVLAFSKMVMAAYPGTGSSGIVRDCSVGGRSEHKEGRAWDWTVSYASTRQRGQAANLINWLFAADKYNHRYTNARRLGVMYVIWDKKIWGSYAAGAGWRAYTGADPHTGHMHISFSWAGANKKTSFWTGVPAANQGGPTGPGSGTSKPTTGTGGHNWHPREDESSDPNRDSDRRQHRHRRSGGTAVPLPSWDSFPGAMNHRSSTTHRSSRTGGTRPTSTTAPRVPTVSTPAPAPATVDIGMFAAAVLVIVNDERAKVGAAPLSIDSCAQAAADAWSQHMASTGVLVHNSLTPLLSCSDSVQRAAENIAYGGQTPDRLMSMWMNSPGHRANILNPRLTSIGIGIATDSRGLVWATQDFLG
jgi:uncharacterized protein YkwD